MQSFNLKKANIYKALVFNGTFHPHILKWLRVALLFLGIAALMVFLLAHDYSFDVTAIPVVKDLPFAQELPVLGEDAEFNFALYSALPVSPNIFLGYALLFIPIGLFILFFELFFKFNLTYPKIKESDNIAELLSYDAAYVFATSATISNDISEKEISPNTLLLALAQYKSAHILFLRLGLDPSWVQKQFIKKSQELDKNMLALIPRLSGGQRPLSVSLSQLLNDANTLRQEHGHERIEMTDLFTALFDIHFDFQKLLVNLHLDKNDLNTLSLWHERNRERWESKRRFWLLENLLRSSPLGTGWIYGYTVLLTKYAKDLTLPFLRRESEIRLVGRDKKIKQIEQVLLRGDKQNVLLVGEVGVGKRAIVLGIAQDISRGEAHEELNYKKLLELNVATITASSTKISEVIITLDSLLQEASKIGNVILFIDGFHNFVGGREGLGRIDITEILLPYLQSSNMQVIATTDSISFHKYIGSRTDILSTFERVDMPELPREGVMSILEDLVLGEEVEGKIFFTYAALKTIFEDADKYIHLVPFPEKAINLFNEIVSYMKSQHKEVVEVQDVHNVVTRKTEIPLGKIGVEERERLMKLDEEMHKEIVGQNYAVSTITQAMQRLRAGISKEGKPAGVFLFVGPTGVGKTLTAKVLAKTYFGSEKNMVRFDMSEYQTQESMHRLLGSLNSNTPGQLASRVRDNPYSVLLLDEFEKAHRDILNVFLRIFDEGIMTDVFGRTVNFEQNIIIATSNAGANEIREMVQKGIDPSKEKELLIDLFIKKGYFKPELLNRFDEIVTYHPLSREEIRKVAGLLVNHLVSRLRKKGYYYNPTTEVIDYIAEVGFDPQFGARPMARAIADKLESVIAKKILENQIEKGEEFTVLLKEIGGSGRPA